MQTLVKTKAKILAYLRVSTDKQDLDTQRLAILEYAHKHKLKIKKFIEVQTSSRSSFKERMLDELLANLAAGDTLIVSELSRLGRSLKRAENSDHFFRKLRYKISLGFC